MNAISTIINQWAGIREVAEDAGVKYVTAQMWKQRGSIPPKYWQKLVDGAVRRGLDDVSYDELVNAHTRQTQGAAQ